jgi:anti-sigma-K factor RskA
MHPNPLHTLPTLGPPPALWPAIRSDLDRHQLNRRFRHWAQASMAVAAVAVLAVVTVLIYHPDHSTDIVLADDPALVQARQLSAAMEAQLRQQHLGAVSTASVETLVWLENELGWLDTRLASNPNDIELWQRRAWLLSEMNRLYGLNSWQAQMQLTNL